MPLDTQLPDEFQHRFEQALREVLATRPDNQNLGEVIRYVPPLEGEKDAEEYLSLETYPHLKQVEIQTEASVNQLSITLYFSTSLHDDYQPVADESAPAGVDHPHDGEPSSLSGLSSTHETLADGLFTILAGFLDLPEDDTDRASYYIGNRERFLCTSRIEGAYVFVTYVGYPDFINTIHQAPDYELADQHGIPY